ncbi:hypothetical protein [Pseudofulvibacter geojedonensis]|uniref:Uncharacterized protein n=1 Tax=Pseudofulvibacter geojedonensis TaxID=1123758 RepID=A0ABW3I2J9_9FLAO
MKIYNKYNFFKHTYCEFQEVSENLFKENPAHYKSKSDSLYHYTEEGVYRYSDHWGRVANCRWKLLANSAYKNQQYHLGFAKWTDFYHLNDTDKLFYILVDFESKKVNFQHIGISNKEGKVLFTALEAQKRVKQIRKLFSEDKWARYYNTDIDMLRKEIITDYISSNKSLTVIKKFYKMVS